MLQDLLGGRIDATSAGTPALLPHIKSGKLRADRGRHRQAHPRATRRADRRRAGLSRTSRPRSGTACIVPAGTPREIVMKLNAEINKALRSSPVTQRYAADNAVAGIGTPEQFGAFIAKEQARWRDVVRKANITIE